jgi:hypothetical protein
MRRLHRGEPAVHREGDVPCCHGVCDGPPSGGGDSLFTKLTPRLPRHPFSVISGSDRVALQTEGLSLADSHTRPATERTPESDYGDRFARTHEFRPAI